MSSTQRTKRELRIVGLLAVAASAGAALCAAAQGERLTVEVGQCVDLPTPEQRLACFEAQVEAARGNAPAERAAPEVAERTSREPVAAPRPATPSAADEPEPPAEFGFRERRRPEPEPEPIPELRARIADLRETLPNAFLITLDNGQVWRQTRPDPYVSLKVGYDVRINFSRFRAYRLTSPDMPGYVQVERVR